MLPSTRVRAETGAHSTGSRAVGADARAERQRQVERGAGGARRRRRIRSSRTETLLAHRCMAIEAAAGQHDAAQRVQFAELPVVFHRQPKARPGRLQRDDGRLGPDGDFAPLQRIKEPRNQRIAHHQPRSARVRPAVAQVSREQRHRVAKRAPRLGQFHQVPDILAVDHHSTKDGEFRNRRTHQREFVAEQTTVERQRFKRPPAGRRTLDIRLVVGVRSERAKMHVGHFVQAPDRERTCG